MDIPAGKNIFLNTKKNIVNTEAKPIEEKPNLKIWFIIGFIFLIAIGWYSYQIFNQTESKTLIVKDAFTNKKVNSDEIKAEVVENKTATPIDIIDAEIKIPKENTKVILKSPYYKDKIVIVSKDSQSEITMQPDDYAMMLKAFMKSDIKDWQTRKEQLQKILAEEVEIIVILRDNLGFEYFNKEEFSEKLIIPSASLKKMKIIDIQHNAKNEISFVRIIQE